MSIFIQDTFEIFIDYIEFKNEENKVIAVKVVAEPQENSRRLTCKVKGREADLMYYISEEASIINHITGGPLIRVSVFHKLIFENFFISWNAFDPNEQTPITDNHPPIFYEIKKELVKKWLRVTGGN